MATLVKIRGLDRGNSAGDSNVNAGRGFRLPSPYSSAQGGTGTAKASYTPTANVVTYTANYAGAYANSISIVHATGGAATPVVSVTYPTGGSSAPTITVTGTAATTPQSVVTAVNANPLAASLLTASVAGTGAGTFAAVATTALSGGSDGSGATLTPIPVRTNQTTTVVVDMDNPAVAKLLRRNAGRFISLGAQ